MKKFHLFALILLAAVIVIYDPQLYHPYHSIKNILFISIPVLLLTGWVVFYYIKNKQLEINISFIEALLLIRIVWLFVTNPELPFRQSDFNFSILIIQFLLVIFIRQLYPANNQVFGFFSNVLSFQEMKKVCSTKIKIRKPSSTLQTKTGRSGSVQVQAGNSPLSLLFKTLLICGILESAIGYYQYFRFSDAGAQIIKTPVIGTIGSANGFGLLIAIAIVATAVELIANKRLLNRFALGILTVLFFVILLLNGSRGAFLSLITSGAIVFFLFQNRFLSVKRRSSKYAFTTTLISIVILTGYFLINKNIESSKGRLMVWEITLPMITENPVFGLGHGNYAKEYLNYQAKYFSNAANLKNAYKAANLKQAHNEYLQAFAESGIIGGLLFLSVCLYPMYIFIKCLRTNKGVQIYQYGVLLILGIILIHSFIDTPLHVLPVSILFYVLIGICPVKTFALSIRRRALSYFLIGSLIAVSVLMVVKSFNYYRGYFYWNAGVKNASEHEWETAIEYYRKAETFLPDKGELRFHLGSALVFDKRYSNGAFYLNKSLKNFNDRNIHLSLSYAFLKLKDYSRAEKCAKTALAMFHDHLAPHLLLGEIYFYQGRINESKRSLLKCINEETQRKSAETKQISEDAKRIWSKLYDDNIVKIKKQKTKDK